MDTKRARLNEGQTTHVSAPTNYDSRDELSLSVTPAEYCLSHFAIIVERVFRMLNAKQLCTVAKVCKLWNELVKKERLKRVSIETKMIYLEDEEEDLTDDSEKMMLEIQDGLIQKIKATRCYPALAILYINRSERFYGENASVRLMLKRVYKTLPPETPLIGALAGGVIGCCDHCQVEAVEQTESASLLLVPKSPSTDIHSFFITLTDVRAAGNKMSEWERLIGCPKTLKPKAVLLHACCDTNEVQDAVTMLCQLYGDDLPVAGGVAEYLVDNHKLKFKGINGVLFGGNVTANLKVSVGPDITDLRKNLMEMKSEIGINCKNSLMLMYCCVARGQQLYEKTNAETTCVREIFGKIRTFGFFAFGEIGKSGEYAAQCGRTISKSASAVHSYSTVSCLCNFG